MKSGLTFLVAILLAIVVSDPVLAGPRKHPRPAQEESDAADERARETVVYGALGNIVLHAGVGVLRCMTEDWCLGVEANSSAFNYDAVGLKSRYFLGESFNIDSGLAYAESDANRATGIMSLTLAESVSSCSEQADTADEPTPPPCEILVSGKSKAVNAVVGFGNQWFVGPNGFVFGINWVTLSVPVYRLSSPKARAGEGATGADVDEAQDKLNKDAEPTSLRLFAFEFGWHF